MQEYELDGFLGPFANEVTDEQREAIHRAADTISERYPGEDNVGERELALNGAVQIILGDDTIEAITETWTSTRHREREVHAGLTGAIIATVQGGEAEVALASRLGINRGTIRQALGKPRSRVRTDPVTGLPTIEVGRRISNEDVQTILDDED